VVEAGMEKCQARSVQKMLGRQLRDVLEKKNKKYAETRLC
jgi:hypothetical protein